LPVSVVVKVTKGLTSRGNVSAVKVIGEPDAPVAIAWAELPVESAAALAAERASVSRRKRHCAGALAPVG
jgi:hypothetical protein